MAKRQRKTKPKSVLHTDIKDLEVARTLRRIGNVRVTDWEFRDILPKVKDIAATEVDVLDLFKRTANFRVIDWDMGGKPEVLVPQHPKYPPPTQEEISECTGRLARFLGFIIQHLVDHPGDASIKVSTPSPSEIRFRLILTQRDAAALIGHGGHTAAAIRNLMKEAGTRSRFFVDLKILSQREEAQLVRSQPTRAAWRKVKF